MVTGKSELLIHLPMVVLRTEYNASGNEAATLTLFCNLDRREVLGAEARYDLYLINKVAGNAGKTW